MSRAHPAPPRYCVCCGRQLASRGRHARHCRACKRVCTCSICRTAYPWPLVAGRCYACELVCARLGTDQRRRPAPSTSVHVYRSPLTGQRGHRHGGPHEGEE